VLVTERSVGARVRQRDGKAIAVLLNRPGAPRRGLNGDTAGFSLTTDFPRQRVRYDRKSMHAAAWRWPKGTSEASRRVQPPARMWHPRGIPGPLFRFVRTVRVTLTHAFGLHLLLIALPFLFLRRFGSKQQPRNSARLIKLKAGRIKRLRFDSQTFHPSIEFGLNRVRTYVATTEPYTYSCGSTRAR
jgi:hypothetical protein